MFNKHFTLPNSLSYWPLNLASPVKTFYATFNTIFKMLIGIYARMFTASVGRGARHKTSECFQQQIKTILNDSDVNDSVKIPNMSS